MSPPVPSFPGTVLLRSRPPLSFLVPSSPVLPGPSWSLPGPSPVLLRSFPGPSPVLPRFFPGPSPVLPRSRPSPVPPFELDRSCISVYFTVRLKDPSPPLAVDLFSQGFQKVSLAPLAPALLSVTLLFCSGVATVNYYLIITYYLLIRPGDRF